MFLIEKIYVKGQASESEKKAIAVFSNYLTLLNCNFNRRVYRYVFCLLNFYKLEINRRTTK